MNCNRLTVLTAVAVCGALLITAGCGSVAAPTSYAEYNAKDGSFKCQRPEGWEWKGGGKGYHKATFESGPAKIVLLTKTSTSLIGGIAGGQTTDEDIPEELTAEAELHEFTLEQAAEQFGNYEEKKPEVVETKLGKGRKSEFTASGAFGGKIRGYRATILGHNDSVTVIAQCPEKSWETLKPAFSKIIDSLERGKAEI